MSVEIDLSRRLYQEPERASDFYRQAGDTGRVVAGRSVCEFRYGAAVEW